MGWVKVVSGGVCLDGVRLHSPGSSWLGFGVVGMIGCSR